MKNVHILPHTHWDREWYLPFEEFRYYLVRTIDRLLDELSGNPQYGCFHFDGQTILLKDYFDIRPERREELLHRVRQGKIAIGPFYVLQDEFLTSGEANIRNLARGLREMKDYGGSSYIGYLPDTFGHFSQMPQILTEFGIDNAIFCRGLVSSYDHMRTPDAQLSPSELLWEGADGSRVVGLYGSDWYNNAGNLPANIKDCAEYIKNTAQSADKKSVTGELLLYNGCDHQPPAKGLPQMIKAVNEELAGEYKVCCSDMNTVIQSARNQRDKLAVYKGELTGQQTDGLFSFIHTASVRVDIKRLNQKNESFLERIAEPLTAMAYAEGLPYAKAYMERAWEYLMQNHPHDSICGCGDDAVYREMAVRYEKSLQAAGMIAKEAAQYIAERTDMKTAPVDTEDFTPVLIFNPYSYSLSQPVEITVNFPKDTAVCGLEIKNHKGEEIASSVISQKQIFAFELPEDGFRISKTLKQVKAVVFMENLPPTGYTVIFVKPAEKLAEAEKPMSVTRLDCDLYSAAFAQNGSFTLTDNDTGISSGAMGIFEDSGDVGNEYTFMSPNGDETVVPETADVTLLRETALAYEVEVTSTVLLPEGYERLKNGTKAAVRYDGAEDYSAGKKKSKRSHKKLPTELKTVLTFYKKQKRVDMKTSLVNMTENHRLRVRFCTGQPKDYCLAHTPFDIVKRGVNDRPNWTQDDKSDRMQAFAAVGDKEQFLLSGRGLYEYEYFANGDIALTLLRCVDEMGDWGYFPTPEAQMKGKHCFEYVLFFGEKSQFSEMSRDALCYYGGNLYSVQKSNETTGAELPLQKSYFSAEGRGYLSGAFKVSENGGSLIARLYNPFDRKTTVRFNAEGEMRLSDLPEEKEAPLHADSLDISPKKICTIKII